MSKTPPRPKPRPLSRRQPAPVVTLASAAPTRPARALDGPSRERQLLVAIGMVGVIAFLLGGTWDIGWHIDIGRDTFWSPPHLMLYAGLLAIGLLPPAALALEWRRAGAAGGWRQIHPGLVVAGLGSAMALTAAPIDEAWHRMFGLDLSLWSPPHLQLLAGAILAQLGLVATLASEANRAEPGRVATPLVPFEPRPLAIGQLAGFAIWLMALVGLNSQYAFGIADFPIAYSPVVLAAAITVALFAGARASGFAWGATVIAALFAALQVLLGDFILAAGRTIPLETSVVPAALVVDYLWSRRGFPSRPGDLAPPAALATVVLLASQTAYLRPQAFTPWPVASWPWLLPLCLAAGVGGAILGALIGWAMRPTPVPTAAVARVGGVARLVLGALLALALAIGGVAVAAAHPGHPEPRVELFLPEGIAPMGGTTPIRVRFMPPEDLAPGTLEVIARSAGVELRVDLAPGATLGVFDGAVTLPEPGLWPLRLRFTDSHGDRWLGWSSMFVPVARPEGVADSERRGFRLQPDPTRPMAEIDGRMFAIGHAAILLWIGAATGAAALALRSLAREGIALRAGVASG